MNHQRLVDLRGEVHGPLSFWAALTPRAMLESAMRARPHQAGFTLVELMVSVAIVGILAAAAVPMLVRYIQKAKTTEARTLIQKMADGARVYYLEPQMPPGAILALPAQFPISEPATPAVSCCSASGANKCEPVAAQWETPTWISMNFSVDDPHYYQYEFRSAGTSIASTFTAAAYGDLDCDGIESTFSISGAVIDGEVSKSGNISRVNELD